MNEIKLFNNPEFGEVRAVSINNEPWLVGKDVAQVLGYSNTNKALADHVDIEDKMQGDGVTIRDPMGREQHPTVINESGLYALVLSSKLPGAKKFKHWVTSEVLPSLRKHGAYMTPQTLQEALKNPGALIQILQELQTEQEKNKVLTAQAEEMRPKALFADSVAAANNSILIGELAKLLRQNGVDTGAKRLFAWMRDNGYLIKRKGTDYNMPTQKSMELKLFQIKETVINHSDGNTTVSKTVKVTGKGQVYFINKFMTQKNRGALND